MSAPIRLLSDNVLVEIIKPERLTASKLLIIPDSAKRDDTEMYRGRVIAVGPGKRGIAKQKEFTCATPTQVYTSRVNPCEVKVGDEVCWYFAAGEVALSRSKYGENRVIVPEENIQAVIEA